MTMSGQPTTSAELLQQAKDAYRLGFINYREAMLETGRLLHEFVLAWLREADAKTVWDRTKNKITRQEAIKKASVELDLSIRNTNMAIITWAVFELIAERDVGELTYSGLEPFCVFVERRVCKDGHKSSTPSESEQWQIKPGWAEDARKLFSQARGERWGRQKGMARLRDVFHRKRETPCRKVTPAKRVRGGARGVDKRLSFMELAEKSVSVASPGDVAEMCMTLVDKAEDPQAVAFRLQSMLQKYLPKKAAV